MCSLPSLTHRVILLPETAQKFQVTIFTTSSATSQAWAELFHCADEVKGWLRDTVWAGETAPPSQVLKQFTQKESMLIKYACFQWGTQQEIRKSIFVLLITIMVLYLLQVLASALYEHPASWLSPLLAHQNISALQNWTTVSGSGKLQHFLLPLQDKDNPWQHLFPA